MKPKIAIFQKDLRLGGIQKSLINLLNTIDVDEYEIDLYLFSNENFYEANFPKKINIIHLKKQMDFVRFLPFTFYSFFKRILIDKKYDLAIDFNGYQSITAAYALKVKAKKRIYWIHNDLYIRHSVQKNFILRLSYWVLAQLTRSKWRKFDTFVGVSSGVLDGFRKDFKDKEFIVIPNVIDVDEIREKSLEEITDLKIDDNNLNLAMIGRLEEQKGVDTLISKFVYISRQRKDVHLYIIGSGSLNLSLRKQVSKLGLDERITFLGAKKNPYKYLAVMDGLVLNSRYEGQGMVLMEAKVLGVPYYFPEHLEKYNDGLQGTKDIVASISNATKTTDKHIDTLKEYNRNISVKVSSLFKDSLDETR